MKRPLTDHIYSGTFALSVFLFLLIGYPYHICNQEQFQLFECTWTYVAATLSVPGGFADLCGRFLTQFFISAAAGSAILALLLVSIQKFTARLCKGRGLLFLTLTFVPAVLMLLFFCSGDALLSAPVAIVLSLACACGVRKIASVALRRVITILLTPVLYFLLGPLSIVFVAATVAGERKLWLTVACLAAFALTVWLCHIWMSIPIYRLMYGMNYYRFHHHLPVWPWVSAASIVLLLIINAFMPHFAKCGNSVAICAQCILMLLAAGSVALYYDADDEQYMKYDQLTRRFQWEKTLNEARKDNPDTPYTMAAVNLALVKTGNISQMFSFYQNGTDGLLPAYTNDYKHPIIPSEAYFQLGMINTSQRYSFEAQELIPDFQKSARLCKRLAETNLLNGNDQVALKYLYYLSHTIFYRDWAKSRARFAKKEAPVDSDTGYAYLRSVRLKDHDFLFNRQSMESMLAYLVEENPSNHMALEYLLAWDLLEKNIEGFIHFCPFEGYRSLPVPFQEAYVLDASSKGMTPAQMPQFISPQVAASFSNFLAERNSGADQHRMETRFGSTYWFYYFYRTGK